MISRAPEGGLSKSARDLPKLNRILAIKLLFSLSGNNSPNLRGESISGNQGLPDCLQASIANFLHFASFSVSLPGRHTDFGSLGEKRSNPPHPHLGQRTNNFLPSICLGHRHGNSKNGGWRGHRFSFQYPNPSCLPVHFRNFALGQENLCHREFQPKHRFGHAKPFRGDGFPPRPKPSSSCPLESSIGEKALNLRVIVLLWKKTCLLGNQFKF